ncbi:transketolase family protein [Vampirovibrio sp.]|uniref:transketolase family protein n=1 Tax=Vampirovibrio sp. TaxID=2717857 RepID=UPI003593939A
MTTINLEKPALKALRNQYGETLVALGAENPNIVVLDADLACSTQTQKFADQYPERFFNQGISEQDLINTAAGLSTTGKIPFCSTFAIFAAGKGWDQIRNTVCYSGLNVKICPTHSGLSLGEDGASHQSIEDIALMRVIPGMTVIVPSDAVETDRVIRWAAEYYGPVYVRLVRPNCPVIHDEATYQLDAAMPHRIRVEREGTDISLVATGETVYHALLAAERLQADHGIQAEVLNCVFIKPFDTETLVNSARKTGKVITVESHQILGGLAGVVCEELSTHQPTAVRRLGTQDRFGQSGTGEALFKEYGIDWESIYNEALRWLKG